MYIYFKESYCFGRAGKGWIGKTGKSRGKSDIQLAGWQKFILHAVDFVGRPTSILDYFSTMENQ